MSIVYRKDQKKIMEYTSGTMGIQAVPGAGKTFIITNLVAKLLGDMSSKNDKRKILVLTYMNSAANNFKSRIRKILSDNEISSNNFEVMTIHSLAMKIIKENSNLALIEDEFEIIDDIKKGIIISDSIEKFREIDDNDKKLTFFISKEKRDNKKFVEKWEKEFNFLVRDSIRLLKYANIDDGKLKEITSSRYRGILTLISPIYSNYQESLRLEGYLDYDDILLMAYNILANNPDVAKKYQEKYLYVFEDECQDSNLIQGKIIDIIADGKSNRKKSSKNLVRVGDVNQSITGTFTGSNPKHFIDFCSNADRSFNMNMAGRSSRDIIDLANKLVEFVNNDKDSLYYGSLENLFIEEVEKGKGYKENPNLDEYLINASSVSNGSEELDKIVSLCNYYKEKYPNFSLGILTFSNYEVDAISQNLEAREITHERLGSNPKHRKKLISDIGKILEFLIFPTRTENFIEILDNCFLQRLESIELSDEAKADILGFFGEYLNLKSGEYSSPIELKHSNSKSNVDKLYANIEGVVYSLDKRKEFFRSLSTKVDDMVEHAFFRDFDRFLDGVKDICEYSQSDLGKLIKFICSCFNLSDEEKMLSKYIFFYVDRLTRFENIDLNALLPYFDSRYSRVFDSAIDGIYDMGEKEIEPGSITIATLHKSKGLEWDAVIITGINDSEFPSKLTDYFRVDRKYLRDDYRYPEAFVNMEIENILNGISQDVKHFEIGLKKDLVAERVRLLYVGITRAKKSMFLLNSRQKYIESINLNLTKKDSEFFVELKRKIDGVRGRIRND